MRKYTMTAGTPFPIPLSHWLNACSRGKIQDLEYMAQGRPWPDLQASIPGTTALILAAGNGHVEVCQRLVAHKPKLEAKNDAGQTALFCAVEDDHYEVASLLLKAGADTGVRDMAGRSLILVSVANRNPRMASLLYKHGARSLNGLTQEGLSCLAAAIDIDSIRLVRWLLKHGAQPDVKDGETGVTPLWKATYDDKPEMAHALLNAGAKPNRLDRQGNGYLHVAIEQQNERVIAVLLDAGADPGRPNRNNITPLEYAKDWTRFVELVAESDQRKLELTTPTVAASKKAVRL